MEGIRTRSNAASFETGCVSGAVRYERLSCNAAQCLRVSLGVPPAGRRVEFSRC